MMRFSALCLVAASTLPLVQPLLAVDTDLRLFNEVTVDLGIFHQQVDQGVVRMDGPVLHGEISGRIFGFGLTVDAWMALDRDRARSLRSGDVTEVRARVDYLIEIPNIVQILPHYETSYYPAKRKQISTTLAVPNLMNFNPSSIFPSASDVFNPFRPERWGREAHWLGVDAWFMLPWEGMEIGGSYDYDLGDNAGWRASFGLRQFVQIANLDLATYQVFNYGPAEYHDWLIGVNSAGFTTAEVGITATVPLPWDYFHVYVSGAVHAWLDKQDRDALARSIEVVGGLGIEFRLSDFGF